MTFRNLQPLELDEMMRRLSGEMAAPAAELGAAAVERGLGAGEHVVEVRAFDSWQGEQRARTSWRLAEALP